MRCLIYENGCERRSLNDLSAISEILENPNVLVWLDVIAPQAENLALILEKFNLHPLAVEDAVKAHQRPKIEAYEGYWFIIVHGITLESNIHIHEIAVFAGKNFVVTVRAKPSYPLQEIERRWHAGEKEDRHSGALVYVILDTIVDGYSFAAESYEEQVEVIETELLTSSKQTNEVLLKIFAKKNELQGFRRSVLPVRDILVPIMRGDVAFLSVEDMPYYRDINDHAVRVIDRIDVIHELVSSALEIQISISSNRQNEAVKQLTIIATIFLPLSYITGFFGQNFGFLIDNIKSAKIFFAFGVGSEIVALFLLVVYFFYKRLF
jgi:magnesium transporter